MGRAPRAIQGLFRSYGGGEMLVCKRCKQEYEQLDLDGLCYDCSHNLELPGLLFLLFFIFFSGCTNGNFNKKTPLVHPKGKEPLCIFQNNTRSTLEIWEIEVFASQKETGQNSVRLDMRSITKNKNAITADAGSPKLSFKNLNASFDGFVFGSDIMTPRGSYQEAIARFSNISLPNEQEFVVNLNDQEIPEGFSSYCEITWN